MVKIGAAMRKQFAIDLLGGSVSKAAKTLGVTNAAVSKWPEELPQRISDRVLGAWARINGFSPARQAAQAVAQSIPQES
jgi:hypothetical protein